MNDWLKVIEWEKLIWLERDGVKVILTPIEGFEIICKSFGIRLRRWLDRMAIDVIDEKRFKEILERHRKRVEDIVVRELVRLQRVKGLEIEDERAKTYFLCAVGYLLRIDYEKRVIEEYIEEKRKSSKIFANGEDIDFLDTRIYHYNKLLRDIRKNDMFKHIVEDFEEIKLNWKYTKGTIEYEVEIDEVRWWNDKGMTVSTLISILRRIRDDLEHMFLSLMGKIVSGK